MELRKQARHRKRRIIFNNDGCDAFSIDGNDAFTRYQPSLIEGFLKERSTGLIGSQVDAIFYSTAVSFGYFAHRTRVGEIFLTKERPCDGNTSHNITPDLIAMGTDPLQLMVEFCRKHKLEIFWSMRMNDQHDGIDQQAGAPFLFPNFKKDHPEYLVGTKGAPPKFGRWTAVDYARPEVRDLAYRFLEEVCRNYDIDGLELDFFRHPLFFRSVAWGGRASQAELDMMTDLVLRVRRMTEEVAVKRNRPLLVAVRLPDSVGYAKAIGLDLLRWLEEDLVDMVTGGCYFHLEPWENLVALGKRYDVPVYACLSGSRLVDPTYPEREGDIKIWRGEAMNAWEAGISGIYTFNRFNPSDPIFRELGSPETLAGLDKTYKLNPGCEIDFWLEGGSKFINFKTSRPQVK